ncbi:uncharacterized protein LOC128228496 [Mya arenaria]|uniref:uncharacterized protein LOC128228496 n=1 Tax=Mya arenaria TaxID=6604 RepID=UPI0022DECF39|nr:uncharacterized protein LOC128228496 [Mya arenaria]XP_052795795.1 uncharacterized protein LOC128228496 [Mya arenaria]XP_052795796.1 uncharacterized protein LOC128228496 [Mya arenaria]
MEDGSSAPKPWGIDFDALIERYMKEANVPHSRKGPIIEPGVVPTGCLRVGTLEEGMTLIPVPGYTLDAFPSYTKMKKKRIQDGLGKPNQPENNLKRQSTSDVKQDSTHYKKERKISISSNDHAQDSNVQEGCEDIAKTHYQDLSTMPFELKNSSPVSLADIEENERMEELALSLIQANEKIFPLSRISIVENFKKLNKPKDVHISTLGDKLERLKYVVSKYNFIGYFEKRVLDSVAFAKKIPGFTDLPLSDRVLLLKESKLDCSNIQGLFCDFETNTFYTDDGTPLAFSDLYDVMGDQEIVVKKFGLTRHIDTLQLTAAEESVLKALSIMLHCKGECTFEEKEQAVVLYDKLQACLKHVVSSYHPNPQLRLQQLRDLLCTIKRAMELTLSFLPQRVENAVPETFKTSLVNEVLEFY